MEEQDKKEFLKRIKNRNTYEVLETFKPPSNEFSLAKKGSIYTSGVIYDWGLNPDDLVKQGKIKLLEKEPYKWQEELVGENVHTVYSWCPECLTFGVNMPLYNECRDCGHTATITYYDAKTINNYLNRLNN